MAVTVVRRFRDSGLLREGDVVLVLSPRRIIREQIKREMYAVLKSDFKVVEIDSGDELQFQCMLVYTHPKGLLGCMVARIGSKDTIKAIARAPAYSRGWPTLTHFQDFIKPIYRYGSLFNRFNLSGRSIFLVLVLIIFITPLSSLASSAQENITDIYLYKLIIETSSDWTTVEFSDGPIIISYNFSLTKGSGAPGLGYTVNPRFIWIGKKAYDTTVVSVAIELIAMKGNETSRLTIKKGDVGSTTVLMYRWRDGSYILEWRIGNEGTNPKYPGTNDRTFSIEFRKLYENPAGSAIYENLAAKFYGYVLAFYYPWYGTPYGASGRWFHWEIISEDYISNAAHYPLLGIYDSQDERLIEAHMLMAKYAGIDGFIASWWGVGSFEDRSLKKLIKVAELKDFKLTIYYESVRTLSMTAIVNELSYIVNEYSKSSAFLKIDGKPVIFIYSVESYGRSPEFWLQVRKSLEDKVGPVYLIGDVRNPAYVYVFDGFHTYMELDDKTMKELYNFYSQNMKFGTIRSDFNQTISKIMAKICPEIQEKITFYTVVPGYDDRKIRKPGMYLDRVNGATYRRFWEDALGLGVKNVLITSWNELHEGTEIEPTREYYFTFLNLTRSYTSQIKNAEGVKVFQPVLTLYIEKRGDEIIFKFSNKGKGPAIALQVEITLLHDVTKKIISNYRQPSRSGSDIFIIPVIRQGEDYLLSLKLDGIQNVEGTLKTRYYSMNGSPYISEALFSIITVTQSTTLTQTSITTTTFTITTTQKLTETSKITITSIREITQTPTIITTLSVILLLTLIMVIIYISVRKRSS